jgi:hypothetical protein
MNKNTELPTLIVTSPQPPSQFQYLQIPSDEYCSIFKSIAKNSTDYTHTNSLSNK